MPKIFPIPVILSTMAVLIACNKNSRVYKTMSVNINDTNLQYIGRWDKSNPAKFTSHWGGAYLRVRFSGSFIKVGLGNNAYKFISIDDKQDYKDSTNETLSFDNLSAGVHTLTVAANSQATELAVTQLQLDDTAQTLPAPIKKPLIEFIGNSVSAGQGTGGIVNAYSWIAAEKMGCDHAQIAFGGIPLVDGYRSSANGSPQHGQSVQYFALKEPNNGLYPAFNFTDYFPVIIVIELGTNDMNLGVPKNLFVSTYIKFIQNIHSKYPDAKIVLFRNSFCAQYSIADYNTIVKTLQSSGIEKVYYIEPQNWISQIDKIDDCHPNIEGHVKLADSLAVKLTEIINK